MVPLRSFVRLTQPGRFVTTTAAVRAEVAQELCEQETLESQPSAPQRPVPRPATKLTPEQEKAHLEFMDPFESVPLRKLATYLGETFSPKLEEIQSHERQRSKPKRYTQVTEPPSIPHFLPLTRWAAESPRVRDTLIDDEGQRKPVRLSWYHPEDTMVPRGWFSKGLLEDINYYQPFWKKRE